MPGGSRAWRKSYHSGLFAGLKGAKNALLSIGEKEIKRLLLERFNSQLTLGKLNAIYFDDYIFLD